MAPGYGIGHEDERGGLCLRHGGSTHDGFARATGQDHDAGATRPERIGGVLLIIPKLPVHLLRAQRDGVGFAVDVAGAVIGGPAGFEQLLFEPPACGWRYGDGVVVNARAQKFADFLGARELLQDDGLVRFEDETVGWMSQQAHAAVARHGLGDVDQQRLRHREPGVILQNVHDLLGIVPGSARIPQG